MCIITSGISFLLQSIQSTSSCSPSSGFNSSCTHQFSSSTTPSVFHYKFKTHLFSTQTASWAKEILKSRNQYSYIEANWRPTGNHIMMTFKGHLWKPKRKKLQIILHIMSPIKWKFLIWHLLYILAYKSQVAFEDLYCMQTSLVINSTEDCYSDVGLFTGRSLQRRRDG